MTLWLLQDATQAVSSSWNYMGSVISFRARTSAVTDVNMGIIHLTVLVLGVPSDLSSFEVFKTDDTRCEDGHCSASLTPPPSLTLA